MILLLFLLLFSRTVYASDYELYAVPRPDGVTIVTYYPGSIDSIEDVMRKYGFSELPYKKINESDKPADRKDRKYWKLSGNKVIVDEAKKQLEASESLSKDLRRKAVLDKLKITEDERKDLLA